MAKIHDNNISTLIEILKKFKKAEKSKKKSN